MESYLKLWFKRFCASGGLAILMILVFAVVAIAVPASITNLIGTATDTTITLTWTKSDTSDNTVIRHSTTTYPETVANGTSTYNGSASYVELTGLSAGTTYYFSAWGFDGSDYSTTALEYKITTKPPSAVGNTTIPYSKPSLPADIAADPDTSSWDISPIDDIIDYISDESLAHGGLGMSSDNLMMFLTGIIIAAIALAVYIKWRNFFSAYVLLLIMTGFACSIGIMQWLALGVLLVIGIGVWAVEKSTQ